MCDSGLCYDGLRKTPADLYVDNLYKTKTILLLFEAREEMETMRPNNWIVCAALKHENGDLILGPRHFDQTMHKQIAQYKLIHCDWKTAEQGFIDKFGNFLTRKEALGIAIDNEQVDNRYQNLPRLYSEDLY